MMLDLEEFLAENLGYGLRYDETVLRLDQKRRTDHVKRYFRDREFAPYIKKQAAECRARRPAKPRPMNPRAYSTQGSKGKWTRYNGEWVKL